MVARSLICLNGSDDAITDRVFVNDVNDAIADCLFLKTCEKSLISARVRFTAALTEFPPRKGDSLLKNELQSSARGSDYVFIS